MVKGKKYAIIQNKTYEFKFPLFTKDYFLKYLKKPIQLLNL